MHLFAGINGCRFGRKSLAVEAADCPKNQAEDYAEDDGAGDGDGDAPVAAPPGEITGEASEGNAEAAKNQKNKAYEYEQKTERDKDASEFRHFFPHGGVRYVQDATF